MNPIVVCILYPGLTTPLGLTSMFSVVRGWSSAGDLWLWLDKLVAQVVSPAYSEVCRASMHVLPAC